MDMTKAIDEIGFIGGGGTNLIAYSHPHFSNNETTRPQTAERPPQIQERSLHISNHVRGGASHVLYVASPPSHSDNRLDHGLQEYMNKTYNTMVPSTFTAPPMCGPGCHKFCRGCCGFFIILLFFMIPFASFLDFFVIYYDGPVSFEVRSLNKTDIYADSQKSALKTVWEFTIAIENPNRRLKVMFVSGLLALDYGKARLGTRSLDESFMLPTTSEILLRSNLSSSRLQDLQPSWIKQAGVEDAHLDLVIEATVEFKALKNTTIRIGCLNYLCPALPVDFLKLSGHQTWSGRHLCKIQDDNYFYKIPQLSE